MNYEFTTGAHRKAFTADPDKYELEYGGWYAYAMADGEKGDVDSKTFKITNGRLFLFYNGWLGNTLPQWSHDGKGLTRRADASWRGIAKEKARLQPSATSRELDFQRCCAPAARGSCLDTQK